MNIFNVDNLRNNQRFPVAVLVGIGVAIICAFVTAIFENATGFRLQILYIGVGYVIGEAIKKFGRGVDIKFQILAVLCVILTLFLSEIIQVFMITSFTFDTILVTVRYTFASIFSLDFGIYNFVIIAYSCYLAFHQSRIV